NVGNGCIACPPGGTHRRVRCGPISHHRTATLSTPKPTGDDSLCGCHACKSHRVQEKDPVGLSQLDDSPDYVVPGQGVAARRSSHGPPLFHSNRSRGTHRMFYEDVRVQRGETVSGLGVEYGYKASEWRKIWDDPKNSALVAKRKVPEQLQIGDILQVPIPW